MNPIRIIYSGVCAEWDGATITIYDRDGVSAYLPCQSLSEALGLMTRDEGEGEGEGEDELILAN